MLKRVFALMVAASLMLVAASMCVFAETDEEVIVDAIDDFDEVSEQGDEFGDENEYGVEPLRAGLFKLATVSLSFSGTTGSVNFTVLGADDVEKIGVTVVVKYKDKETGEWKANCIWPYPVEESKSNRLVDTRTFVGQSGVSYQAFLSASAFTADDSETIKRQSYICTVD